MPILPVQALVQQKGFCILDCYRFSLRDYLSDLLKPQNIEQEILNVEVKNPVLPHGALEDECRSIRFLVLISMGPEGGSRRGIAEYLR